jgi:hypothetical protein
MYVFSALDHDEDPYSIQRGRSGDSTWRVTEQCRDPAAARCAEDLHEIQGPDAHEWAALRAGHMG